MSCSLSRWISAPILLLLALPAFAGSLLFAVNEGTSSATDAIFIKEKYAALANYLAAATGENIRLETPKVLSIVQRNLARKRYDLLLVRPSNLSARALRDQDYRLLAVANGNAKVHFIVRADSKLKEITDIHGHSIALPDPLAYPSTLGLALLRDLGVKVNPQQIKYMDRQDAVGLVVQSGLADVGVVMSYSKTGAEWAANGGRFLYSKGKLPYWSVIVSSQVAPKTVERLQRALLALNQPPSKDKILNSLGIAGFSEGDTQAYLDMLDWVEGRRPAKIAKVERP